MSESITDELLERTSYFDVELAEDLRRRVPNYNTLKQLSDFFRMLLAQYAEETIYVRAKIKDNVEKEEWFNSFFKYVLPFIKEKGLPCYTDTKSVPIFQSL